MPVTEESGIKSVYESVQHSGGCLAALRDPQTGVWLWARSRSTQPGYLFDGALWALIQGLCEVSNTGSWGLLRQRIYLSQPPSLAEQMLVKLGAKRYGLFGEVLQSDEFSDSWAQQIQGTEVNLNAQLSLFPEWQRMQELVGTQWSLEHQAESANGGKLLDELERRIEGLPGRRVGAAILSPEGTVLSAAVNVPSLAPIWHAELLALRDWSVRRGTYNLNTSRFVIVTTLKPCRFCAALCVEMLFDSRVPAAPLVFYKHFDQGPFARQSVLNAHSHDRAKSQIVDSALELERQWSE